MLSGSKTSRPTGCEGSFERASVDPFLTLRVSLMH